MAYFNELDNGDDHGKLVDLVKAIWQFLQDLAFAPEKQPSETQYRSEALRKAVQHAWSEDVVPRIPAFISDVEKLSTGDAQRAGLTGASLSAKIAIMAWWEQQLALLGGRALRWLLAAINSMLGSLLSLIPGTDPIKEAKEMLENSLDTD